jgi:hypothetical protein
MARWVGGSEVAMALSMDEQRILEEMERKLADDDPLLASRLTSFGRPGLAALMRSRRARIVYALTPFRSERSVPGRSAPPHDVSRPVTHARTTGAPGSP